MATHTRYLRALQLSESQFEITLDASSPPPIIQSAIERVKDLRYSPILPAYLIPGQTPPLPSGSLESVALLFCRSPYNVLGALKPELTADERDAVHFSLGLASIVLINLSPERVRELALVIGRPAVEYWPISNGRLERNNISVHNTDPHLCEMNFIRLPQATSSDIEVYIEQIDSSIASLYDSYLRYFPEEVKTLERITEILAQLINQYATYSSAHPEKDNDGLLYQEQRNAIISALVELSAALSYAVTQGTTGRPPVLENRSPFPHHSLLGIGSSIRALTVFIRYLERAFCSRHAGSVIEEQFSGVSTRVAPSISLYASGPEYRFSDSGEDDFDKGGAFPTQDHVPLIAHFSLRHGFKESKFSVTAASEALTAEVHPHWTLMTMSHEVMHSRVRQIFSSLFGSNWDDKVFAIDEDHYKDFKVWYESRAKQGAAFLDCGLRNAVLYYCLAMDCASSPRKRQAASPGKGRKIGTIEELIETYNRSKPLAVELFVHVHDYYFVYAHQPKLYAMSLWASWIKVAAPFRHPLEYLTRTLATLACGTGLDTRPAFEYAVDILLEALDQLEAADITSPMFAVLKSYVAEGPGQEKAYALFKPSYYLTDHALRFFYSSEIVKKIDRIESDPFTGGSALADDYSADIYVYGEGSKSTQVSPIRYSLASLFKSMTMALPIDDVQWLSAWNFMVISSQEVM